MRKIEESVAKTFEAAGVKSVLVGISGGADSVALINACVRIRHRISLHIEAVNCNFHLRGAESDRDSAFTASLCNRLGIPLHSLDYDVARYKEKHPGISTEMACRELRYADFFRICRDRGLDRVAIAHNADDDIETMLLALMRGSGTRGLRGMDAVNDKVIRPLLGITRSEIEEYLSEIGQDFITDSSNLTSEYRRNFLRHDIIPLLESRWPGAGKALSRSLAIMKEESAIVEASYRNQLDLLCPDPFTLLIYEAGVTPGTIHRFMEPFGGNRSIAEEIAESVHKDFRQRSWKLSLRYEAILERDRLRIMDRDSKTAETILEWKSLSMTPELMKAIKGNRSHDIVFLPNDAPAYELRPPLTGDRMAPLGMKGTRLVSDIISDAGLDRTAKRALRVLVRRSDGEIIWLTGLKRSRHDLISEESGIIYKATVLPGPEL